MRVYESPYLYNTATEKEGGRRKEEGGRRNEEGGRRNENTPYKHVIHFLPQRAAFLLRTVRLVQIEPEHCDEVTDFFIFH